MESRLHQVSPAMTEEMQTNRRLTPRKRLNQLAYIRIGADNGGLISDLGETGLGFQTIAAIEKEGPLRFWFTLDNADRLQATGELVWTDESRKVGGLRFTQISKEDVEIIRNWVGKSEVATEPVAVPQGAAQQQQQQRQQPPQPPQPRDTLRFATPPPRKTKSGASPMPASAMPEPAPVAVAPPMPLPQPAPRVEPLRVMASPQMWAPPVLSSPPKAIVSPEMVRGLTTGLTVLAVILTIVALVAGYHRELGESIVRMGQKLTGESQLGEVSPQQTDPTYAQQSQPPAADSNAGAQPAATQPVTTQPVATQPVVKPAATEPTAAPHIPPSAAPAPAASLPSDSATPISTTPTTTPRRSNAGFQNLSANSADTGQLELDTAQQFLGANPNYTEAAKWLWLAVEKGNPKAEVQLASLFIRGDGVTRSCDQARVLLAAAIRHGSKEAGAKLRLLSEYGCR